MQSYCCLGMVYCSELDQIFGLVLILRASRRPQSILRTIFEVLLSQALQK